MQPLKGYKYFLNCLFWNRMLKNYFKLSASRKVTWIVQEYYYLNLLFVCYLPYRKSYTLFFSDKNMNNGESVSSNTVLRCFSGVLKALNSDRLHIPFI